MTHVQSTIELLFEGFRSRPRPETEWVEHLLKLPALSQAIIDDAILVAIAMYCPNLPDERIPVVVAILREAVLAAHGSGPSNGPARA